MISECQTQAVAESRRSHAVQFMRIAANLALAAPLLSLLLIPWVYLAEKARDGYARTHIALAGAFIVFSIMAFYMFAIEANRRSQGERRIRKKVVATLFLYPILFWAAAIPVARLCFSQLGASHAFDFPTAMVWVTAISLALMSLTLPAVYVMTLLSLRACRRSSS